MKEIRVLHITEPFAAGVYNYVKEICRFFDTQPDFKSFVIFSPNRNGTDFDKIAKDFSEDTTLIQVPMTREINPKEDLKAIRSLITEIKKIQPDVIHLHSSKASILGRIASAFYRKAAVYYTPNGYSFLRQDISPKKKKFFFQVEKWITKLFGGTTIACGDTEYEHALRIGKAKLVRNGVSPQELSKFRSETTKDSFKVGTMGRLSPQKNPQLFNAVAEQLPEIEFVWIGAGQLATELTSPNIEVTGWKAHTDAMKLVNSFDVYIQTSLWEGLPFTIIEAMALGKPVVATEVVGNKDAVQDGYNGYLCNDADTFAERLAHLSKDENSLHQMGENSLTRCDEVFDQQKNFEGLRDIYAGVK